MDFLSVLLALIVGLLAGWFLGHTRLSRTREELAAVKAQTDERARFAAREKEFFDQSIEDMKAKFLGLAQTALQANNKQFLQNTEVKIKPLSDALKQLEVKTGELEKKRDTAYGEISQQIKAMMEAAPHFVGEHDFVGFTKMNHGRESTARKIDACYVSILGEHRIAIDASVPLIKVFLSSHARHHSVPAGKQR